MLKIRMARAGAKKKPFYHIVVTDSRQPRDGKFIERLGTYNPMLPREHADRVTLKGERIQYWISKGAQASDRVAIFLGKAGLAAMPERKNNTQKSAPKAKMVERAKEKASKIAAAADAAAEAKAAASAPAPAAVEETAPAAEVAEAAPAAEAEAQA